MKNAAIVLLGHALVVVSVIAYRQAASVKTRSAILDLQAKCAKQAGAVATRSADWGPSGTYQSHYNARLGKCFVLTKNDRPMGGSAELRVRHLLDAFELKEYGRWADFTNTLVPTAPVCRVLQHWGGWNTCATEEGFLKLVKAYMEE